MNLCKAVTGLSGSDGPEHTRFLYNPLVPVAKDSRREARAHLGRSRRTAVTWGLRGSVLTLPGRREVAVAVTPLHS